MAFIILNTGSKRASFGRPIIDAEGLSAEEFSEFMTKNQYQPINGNFFRDFYDFDDQFIAAKMQAVSDFLDNDEFKNGAKYDASGRVNLNTGATSRFAAIRQVEAARDQWDALDNILKGTKDGVVWGFDIETIGDVTRTHNDKVVTDAYGHRRPKGQERYIHGHTWEDSNGKWHTGVEDGYAGITEIGLYRTRYENGVAKSTDSFHVINPLSRQQINRVKQVFKKYKDYGAEALNSDEKWALEYFSRFGTAKVPGEVFGKMGSADIPHFEQNGELIVVNNKSKITAGSLDETRIDQGIKVWEAMSDSKSRLGAGDDTLKSLSNFFKRIGIDEASNTTMNELVVMANGTYDLTAINYAIREQILKDPNNTSSSLLIGLEDYNKVIDTMNANMYIASELYSGSSRSLNDVRSVNNSFIGEGANTVEAMMKASGNTQGEKHIAPLDARDQADLATDRGYFITRNGQRYTMAEKVIQARNQMAKDRGSGARDITENITKFKDVFDKTYIFHTGMLDPNTGDFAVKTFDGEEKAVRNYSYRNRPVRITHAGYLDIDSKTMATKSHPQVATFGSGSAERVFMVEMESLVESQEGSGVRFYKMFRSEDDFLNNLRQNAIGINNKELVNKFDSNKTTLIEASLREEERMANMDLAARNWDRFFEVGEIGISDSRSINGYVGYLDFKQALREVEEEGGLEEAIAKINWDTPASKRDTAIGRFFYDDTAQRRGIFLAMQERYQQESKVLDLAENIAKKAVGEHSGISTDNRLNSIITAVFGRAYDKIKEDIEWDVDRQYRPIRSEVSLLSDVFSMDVLSKNDEIRTVNVYSYESIFNDLRKAVDNDISTFNKMILNLRERGIISKKSFRDIKRAMMSTDGYGELLSQSGLPALTDAIYRNTRMFVNGEIPVTFKKTKRSKNDPVNKFLDRLYEENASRQHTYAEAIMHSSTRYGIDPKDTDFYTFLKRRNEYWKGKLPKDLGDGDTWQTVDVKDLSFLSKDYKDELKIDQRIYRHYKFLENKRLEGSNTRYQNIMQRGAGYRVVFERDNLGNIKTMLLHISKYDKDSDEVTFKEVESKIPIEARNADGSVKIETLNDVYDKKRKNINVSQYESEMEEFVGRVQYASGFDTPSKTDGAVAGFDTDAFKQYEREIDDILKELNYTEGDREKLITNLFGTAKHGSKYNYSFLDNNLSMHFIKPDSDTRGFQSAYLILSHVSDEQRVTDKLLELEELGELNFANRKEVEKEFGDLGSIIEFKKVHEMHIGNSREFDIDDASAKFMGWKPSDQGGYDVTYNTVRVGKGEEKVIVPSIQVYTDKENITSVRAASASSDLSGALLRSAMGVKESTLAREYEAGTSKAARMLDSVTSEMSAPKSYAVLDGKRQFIPNMADLQDSFKFKVDKVPGDLIEKQVSAILNLKVPVEGIDAIAKDNPLINSLLMLGLNSEVLTERQVRGFGKDPFKDMQIIKKFLESNSYRETSKRLMQVNSVWQDADFQDAMKRLNVDLSARKELYDKSLIDMIEDNFRDKGEIGERISIKFDKSAPDTFSFIKSAMKKSFQVSTENDVKKSYNTFVSPAFMTPGMSATSSQRPTFGQVMNFKWLRPNNEINSFRGSRIGITQDTQYVNAIKTDIRPENIENSFKGYESGVLTYTKQMNDVDLAIRYKSVENEISTALENVTGHKLKEHLYLQQRALKEFKDVYASLYEGKGFAAPGFVNAMDIVDDPTKKQVFDLRKADQKVIDDLINKYINTGRTIKYGDRVGNRIWNGPETVLTAQNLEEFQTLGESRINLLHRPPSDIKVIAGGEKTTFRNMVVTEEMINSINSVQDEFAGRFFNKKEIEGVMRELWDVVFGNAELGPDGTVTRTGSFDITSVLNMPVEKHGTGKVIETKFNIATSVFKDSSQSQSLAAFMNGLNVFKGYNVRAGKDGTIIYNPAVAGTAVNKISYEGSMRHLFDFLETATDEEIEQSGLSVDTVNKYRQELAEVTAKDVTKHEVRVSNVNETYGESLKFNDRIKQADALRGYELNKYVANSNSIQEALDFIAAVRHDSATFDPDEGLFYNNAFQGNDYALERYNKLVEHERIIGERELMRRQDASNSMSGMIRAFTDYHSGVNKPPKDAPVVHVSDIVKQFKNKTDVDSDEITRLLFRNNGQLSAFLKNEFGAKDKAQFFWLDFGMNIKVNDKDYKGVMLPVLTTKYSDSGKMYPTKTQQNMVRLFRELNNAYNGVPKDYAENIIKAINKFYDKVGEELLAYKKDSEITKTFSNEIIRNSSYALAQDEMAPVTIGILEHKYSNGKTIAEEYEEGRQILKELQSGSLTEKQKRKMAKQYNAIETRRNKFLQNISEDIAAGKASEEFYQFVSGSFGANNRWNRVYEKVNGKTYFINGVEAGRDFFTERLGYNAELSGRALVEALQSKKLSNYEINDEFESFLRDFVEENESLFKKEHEVYEARNAYTIKDINQAIKNSPKLQLINEQYDKIGWKYAELVGLQGGDYIRNPVFSSQTVGKLFLNDNIVGHQLRTINPVATEIQHLDFDGDQIAASIILERGGVVTKKTNKTFELASSIFKNQSVRLTQLTAKLFADGDSFKVDIVNNLDKFTLAEMEKYDIDRYTKVVNKYLKDNKISKSIDELTDADKIIMSQNEYVLKQAKKFGSHLDLVRDPKVIAASLAAYERKGNIGSISQPGRRLRETLLTLAQKNKNGEVEADEIYEIMHLLTGMSSDRFLTLAEQKSIDVKHIFDAINTAKTPLYSQGVKNMFTVDASLATKTKGMKQVLSATLDPIIGNRQKPDEKMISKMLDIIINTPNRDEDQFKKALAKKNLDESLSKFAMQYRAIWDATKLGDSAEIMNSIILAGTEDAKKQAQFFKEAIYSDLSPLNINDYNLTNNILINVAKKMGYIDDMPDYGRVYFTRPTSKDFHGIQAYAFVDAFANDNYFKQYDFTDGPDGRQIHYGTSIKAENLLSDSNGDLLYVSEQEFRNAIRSGSKENLEKILTRAGVKDITEHALQTGQLTTLQPMSNSITHDWGGLKINEIVNTMFPDKKSIGQANEIINAMDYIFESYNSSDMTAKEAMRQINQSISEDFDRYFNNKSEMKQYSEYVSDFIKANTYYNTDKKIKKAVKRSKYLRGVDYRGIKDQINEIHSKGVIDINSIVGKYSEEMDELNIIKNGIQESNVDGSYDDILSTIDNFMQDSTKPQRMYNSLINNSIKLSSGTDSAVLNAKGLTAKGIDVLFGFDLNTSRLTKVAFGQFMGYKFGDLSKSDITLIQDIGKRMLKNNNLTKNEKYAIVNTIDRLKEYADNHVEKIATNPSSVNYRVPKELMEPSKQVKAFKANILDEKERAEVTGEVSEEAAEKLKSKIFDEDFFDSKLDDAGKDAAATAEQMAKESVKSASNDMKDVFKNLNLNKGTVLKGVGALAAIGIINNLLHMGNNDSPLVPKHHEQKSHSNQSDTVPRIPRENTLYHSSNGFQYKISAKSKSILDAQQQSQMLMSNMSGMSGSVSTSSQQDSSSVSDNWLSNKFAELA